MRIREISIEILNITYGKNMIPDKKFEEILKISDNYEITDVDIFIEHGQLSKHMYYSSVILKYEEPLGKVCSVPKLLGKLNELNRIANKVKLNNDVAKILKISVMECNDKTKNEIISLLFRCIIGNGSPSFKEEMKISDSIYPRLRKISLFNEKVVIIPGENTLVLIDFFDQATEKRDFDEIYNHSLRIGFRRILLLRLFTLQLLRKITELLQEAWRRQKLENLYAIWYSHLEQHAEIDFLKITKDPIFSNVLDEIMRIFEIEKISNMVTDKLKWLINIIERLEEYRKYLRDIMITIVFAIIASLTIDNLFWRYLEIYRTNIWIQIVLLSFIFCLIILSAELTSRLYTKRKRYKIFREEFLHT